MNFDRFKEILSEEVNNIIIEPRLTETKKEKGSFCELLYRDLPSMQSINIKMGNCLERTWKLLISEESDVVFDARKKILGHQIDILFHKNEETYYLESKNNLNIDTEKTIATYNKLVTIRNFLEEEERQNVFSKVLNNRYSYGYLVKDFKYPITQNDIMGYSELFEVFNVSVDKLEWENFFLDIGNNILRGARCWIQ